MHTMIIIGLTVLGIALIYILSVIVEKIAAFRAYRKAFAACVASFTATMLDKGAVITKFSTDGNIVDSKLKEVRIMVSKESEDAIMQCFTLMNTIEENLLQGSSGRFLVWSRSYLVGLRKNIFSLLDALDAIEGVSFKKKDATIAHVALDTV